MSIITSPLAMLDPVVSQLLKELTSISFQQLKEEVNLLAGVEGEVEKLRLNLNAIQAVMAKEAIPKLLKKDATTTNNAWSDELKKAAYDIEDVLDAWDTAMKLKSSAEEDRSTPATFMHRWMVCTMSFLSSCCFPVSEVGLRHDIGRKIKTLNEKLNDIAALKDKYHTGSVSFTEQTVERHMTASSITETEVKGRKNDEVKLINMLLSDTSNLHTISLVGVGGIGKTTLAKLAYNNDKVKAHFCKKLWVCVSDPFEEIKIANAILVSLTGANSSFYGLELEDLLKKIVQSIEGNNFLLVLDDVWNEESRKWEQLKCSLLKCSLMRGASGSRILVTTRNEKVAKIMGSTESDIIRLGLLSDEKCWSIFRLQVAFSERTSREREQLEETGRKIVKKCKGLPLAAKTLGGLLRFKKSKEDWDRVLNNELWQLEEAEIERDLFAPLCLSYYDLSFSLRRCFSYCATFPKDHEIVVDELIELWMAQGFLREIPNKDMEILGEEYFQNLLMRSFFQDFREEEIDDTMIRLCGMHDIVHDFAQFVSKDECFHMEKYESKDLNKQSISKEVRHFYIPAALFDQKTLFGFDCNLEKLRTIFIVSNYSRLFLTDIDTLLNRLICLRSLCLKECNIVELPSSINCLIHLRYLDLSYNSNLDSLPKEICDLINLQTLNLSHCKNLERLPQEIEKLINLRHLRNKGCNYYLPKVIGRLSCLRTLELFNIGPSSGEELEELEASSSIFEELEERASLRDLKNLKHLRGSLMILGLCYVIDVDEAKQVQLKQMHRITSLTLCFVDWVNPRDMDLEKEKELSEALEPSPNLESLVLLAYSGPPTVFPSWIDSLTNLRILRIGACRNWEYLPCLGKLSSLESLELLLMDEVKKVGNEFLGVVENNEMLSSTAVAFPNLNALSFEDFPAWEEWDMDGINLKNNMLTIMPRLKQLTILGCRSLKKLPDHIRHFTTLDLLIINWCPILKERCKRGTGEDWPKISHIPNIRIMSDYLQKEGKPTEDGSSDVDSQSSIEEK